MVLFAAWHTQTHKWKLWNEQYRQNDITLDFINGMQWKWIRFLNDAGVALVLSSKFGFSKKMKGEKRHNHTMTNGFLCWNEHIQIHVYKCHSIATSTYKTFTQTVKKICVRMKKIQQQQQRGRRRRRQRQRQPKWRVSKMEKEKNTHYTHARTNLLTKLFCTFVWYARTISGTCCNPRSAEWGI